MSKRRQYLLWLFSLCLFACTTSDKRASLPAASKVLVDESFAPIVEDQFAVFESSYPDHNLQLIYKPEVQIINLLMSDSIKVAIMSRKLLASEQQVFTKKGIVVRSTRLATDAIALVTNNTSKDTTITVEEIIAVIKGYATPRQLVFDNANSSTVRYLKDLAKVNSLPKKGIYALKSSAEVIKYIHNNPETIGVIGYNWTRQPPKELQNMVSELKLLSVKNSNSEKGGDKFYKPNQSNLALGLYPLSRELYFIDCKGGTGTSSLAAFMAGERGQRIMLKSGLLPDSVPPREVIIRKELFKQ